MRILLLLVFLSACAPISELEYKRKQMHKQDKKMFKQIKRSRR